MRRQVQKNCAFTLVELIVVVMVLGILAAIAAPKLLGTSQAATDNCARHSLSVIRTAIDSFTAQHDGSLPGADGNDVTFKSDLTPYLRGQDFPKCTVGAVRSNEVRMMVTGEDPGVGATAATHSWAYNYETGEFYINSQEMSHDEVTTYDKF
jgi:general secretion pathway protein G